MEDNNKIVGAMQKAISELHRVMRSVREYLEKKTMNAAVAAMNIDYSDPEQEFYLRIFTEVEQLATTMNMAMDYVDRPVRKRGTLVYDFSLGKYKVDDEYIEVNQLLEVLIDNKWQIVKMRKKEGSSLEYTLMNALKNNIYDIEPKGLTARLR